MIQNGNQLVNVRNNQKVFEINKNNEIHLKSMDNSVDLSTSWENLNEYWEENEFNKWIGGDMMTDGILYLNERYNRKDVFIVVPLSNNSLETTLTSYLDCLRYSKMKETWKEKESIYFTLNDRNHWAILEIKKKKKNEYHWKVIDSIDKYDWKRQINFSLRILSLVLRKTKTKENGKFGNKKEFFDFVVFKESNEKSTKSSQQKNGCDCGYFTLFNLECILRGKGIVQINEDKFVEMKRKIIIKIWSMMSLTKYLENISKQFKFMDKNKIREKRIEILRNNQDKFNFLKVPNILPTSDENVNSNKINLEFLKLFGLVVDDVF